MLKTTKSNSNLSAETFIEGLLSFGSAMLLSNLQIVGANERKLTAAIQNNESKCSEYYEAVFASYNAGKTPRAVKLDEKHVISLVNMYRQYAKL